MTHYTSFRSTHASNTEPEEVCFDEFQVPDPCFSLLLSLPRMSSVGSMSLDEPHEQRSQGRREFGDSRSRGRASMAHVR